MSKLFTIFICFFAITAFAQSEINQTDASGKKQGYWKKLQENGNPLYEGTFVDDKPVGEFKRYHTNGRVKAIFNYIQNTDSATVVMYDEDGIKIAKGQYVNQKKEGIWTYFDEGQKVSEETFMNDLKNGKSKTYYPNSGELYEETDWVNGQETGIYRAYYKSGKVYFETKMLNGKRDGFCNSFYENGSLEMEGFYVQGLRHNEWNYYDKDGLLSYSLIYQNGELQNPEVQDSIATIKLNELDKNKGTIADPEQFQNDPSQYIMQMNGR